MLRACFPARSALALPRLLRSAVQTPLSAAAADAGDGDALDAFRSARRPETYGEDVSIVRRAAPDGLWAGLDEDALPEDASEQLKRVLALRNRPLGEQKELALAAVTRRFERFPGDTGSSEVQVARLKVRLDALNSHLDAHPRDTHNRRARDGIEIKMYKLLKYMRRRDYDAYARCVTELQLKPLPRAASGSRVPLRAGWKKALRAKQLQQLYPGVQ